MSSSGRLLSSLVSAAVLLACSAVADDWPQFRGPHRNGVSDETGWLQEWPPVVLWKKSLGWGYSSPVVSEGRVYHNTSDGSAVSNTYPAVEEVLWCFDADTGEELWTTVYAQHGCGHGNGPGKGTRATPTVDGNRIYTFSYDGNLELF